VLSATACDGLWSALVLCRRDRHDKDSTVSVRPDGGRDASGFDAGWRSWGTDTGWQYGGG
jgi:hypothetical protein